jgi:hypothetical protein
MWLTVQGHMVTQYVKLLTLGTTWESSIANFKRTRLATKV